MDRLTFHDYAMGMAWAAGRRSTCPRQACGAVVVQSGQVISTGFNGAPSGQPHCYELGCQLWLVRERERCIRIVHAEANALLKAGGRGDTLYTTGLPCLECLKLVLNTNIHLVYWMDDYPDTARNALLDEIQWSRLELRHLDVRPILKELIDEELPPGP